MRASLRFANRWANACRFRFASYTLGSLERLPMKALSVRAPWWFAILHGKPVENRDWNTKMRGRVLLHAGKFWKPLEIEEDWEDVLFMAKKDELAMPEPSWPEMKAAGGCLVGSVEIYDCVREHPSAFFVGEYGFLVREPIAFDKPVPFKGALGFFDVPDSVIGDAGNMIR